MKLIKLIAVTACAFTLVAGSAFAAGKAAKKTCCEKAKAAGKTCTHPCCVEAAKEGKVCLKCNPAKKDEAKKDNAK
jgi:hypothetical protein